MAYFLLLNTILVLAILCQLRVIHHSQIHIRERIHKMGQDLAAVEAFLPKFRDDLAAIKAGVQALIDKINAGGTDAAAIKADLQPIADGLDAVVASFPPATPTP